MNESDCQLKLIDRNSNEVDSAISFLNIALKHGMNNKLWNWEFNTFPDKTVLAIVKEKNDVVGTLFMLPVYLNVQGKDILTGKNESGYLHANFKGKGIFEKLYSFAIKQSQEKQMKIMWGFTSVAKIWKAKLGFEVFDIMYNSEFIVGKNTFKNLEVYSKNKIKNSLKYLIHFAQFLVFKTKLTFFKRSLKYPQIHNKYKLSDLPHSYADIEKLYNNLRQQNNKLTHISINEPFFKWRISDNYNLKYIYKFFYKENSLEGYYVVSINGSYAHINDFTYASSETAGVMATYLFNEFSKMGIIYCRYFGNIENDLNRGIFELFKNFGGKITKGMPFVFKNISDLNPDFDFQKLAKNWYLNGLWTEGIRY